MKKRFLVIPGFVISRSDGDRHHVSGKQLMELYRVDPRECLELSEQVARDERAPPPAGYTWSYLNSLIHLTPRHDGDYSQFWL